MQFRITFLGIILLLSASNTFAQQSELLIEAQTLRLQGALAEAQALIEQTLDAHIQSPSQEIELRLELARIYDRTGLHHNTRPVVAALEEIDAAAAMAEGAGPLALAQVELARGVYHYRAEMAERSFPTASAHVHAAIELFQQIGDKRGEADAVHQLGLIHLQRRELDTAHTLFDRSLELDRAGGERVFFKGEYERHVGFVHLLNGEPAAAIPFFERSLAFRREAGAVDASLFAANSLASALVDVGRFDEARPPLLYAIVVAQRLNSPAGKARNGLVLGRLYLAEGDDEAARLAFEMTIEAAGSLGYASTARQAREAIERLEAQDER